MLILYFYKNSKRLEGEQTFKIILLFYFKFFALVLVWGVKVLAVQGTLALGGSIPVLPPIVEAVGPVPACTPGSCALLKH